MHRSVALSRLYLTPALSDQLTSRHSAVWPTLALPQRAAALARLEPTLQAAAPKFEVKRHGASDYSNDCRAVSPGSYSASNIAGSAYTVALDKV
jgi:hypothetical protein